EVWSVIASMRRSSFEHDLVRKTGAHFSGSCWVHAGHSQSGLIRIRRFCNNLLRTAFHRISAMLRSIATVSLGGTLVEKLNAIAAAGFDGVEIFENDLLYFDGRPAEVRTICADLGLRVLLFQPFRDFEAAPRARMAKNFDRAESKFDVMEQLGADLMLVCSNIAPDAIDDDSVAAADLRALGERAARRGFRIGYEALAWGRNVNTFARAWKLVQAADHPAVGLVVDSFHTFAIEDDDAPIAD